MSTGWIIALIGGALIIAGLSFYLGRLLLLLKHNKQLQAEKTTTRNLTLSQSIYTIAWAMREGQCELSEGCLRIWVLLDHYVHSKPQNNQQRYPGIFKLYDKVKDMPTHDARKKYKNAEILKMDKTRWQCEKLNKGQIELDVAKLIERFAKDGHKQPNIASAM
jgi:hypothetical protein